MLQLYFYPQGFPRTIGRKEWKEIWRWRRIVQKKLIEELQRQTDNLIMYGDTLPRYMREDMYDKLINPPLLIHDKQGFS